MWIYRFGVLLVTKGTAGRTKRKHVPYVTKRDLLRRVSCYLFAEALDMPIRRISASLPLGDAKRAGLLRGLFWLSYGEAARIRPILKSEYFKAGRVLFSSSAYPDGVHFLLTGAVCVINENQGKLVAVLPPGVIPEFQPPDHLGHHFRFQAFTTCEIGTLGWESFMGLDANLSVATLRRFIEQITIQFSKVLARGAGFFDLSLRDRLIVTLLQLAKDFGVPDSRGRLIPLHFTHKALADLACGSRPKVTGILAELEQEKKLIRDREHFILRIDGFAPNSSPRWNRGARALRGSDSSNSTLPRRNRGKSTESPISREEN